jgi:hypothetical protein
MTHDEEQRMAIAIFAYTCAAIGGQADRDWVQNMMAEVRDGPHRLIELAHEGLLIWTVAVLDAGTQLLGVVQTPNGPQLLVEVNAKNLGLSDESVAEWGRIAAENGAVHVTVPDLPADLQDPNEGEEGE